MTDQINVPAPEGSSWSMDEVSTGGGKESLGSVPLLNWADAQGAVNHYGVEGVLAALNGTSLRVSYQAIGRRMKIAGKSNDEIAKAIVEFKPGNRTVAAATPTSRARNAAVAAAAKVDGDVLAAFLAKVAAGEIDLAALNTQR